MKRLRLWLAFFPFICSLALAQVPTLTPTTSSLQEGQTLTISCSANCTSLTWKVNGITGGNSTVGTISGSGSTATYTAPASIVANHTLQGGCPVGFNDSIWNVPISDIPLMTAWNGDSFLNDAWYQFFEYANDGHKTVISGAPGLNDTEHTAIADATTPLVTINGIANVLMPQTPEARRESGNYSAHFTDEHMATTRITDCFLTENYQDNPITTACGSNPSPCYTGTNPAHIVAYNTNYGWIGGVDAGGGLLSPYNLNLQEVEAAWHQGIPIKHALHANMPQGLDSYANNLMWPATWGTGYCGATNIVGVTINNAGSGYSSSTYITFGSLDPGSTTYQPPQRAAVTPKWLATVDGSGHITGATWYYNGATSNSGGEFVAGTTSVAAIITDPNGTGSGATATGTVDYQCIPYGARIGLDQTYLANHTGTSCPAGSNCLTGAGLAVATALANYGALILDNQSSGGGAWLFNADDDLSEDPTARNSIMSALGTLRFSNFHVYDQTKLAISTARGVDKAHGCNDDFAGQPCNVALVQPGNDLGVIPPGAVWITATNGSGASLPINIPLAPATVGTEDPVLYMLAGDYSGSKGTSNGYQIPYWVHGTTATAVTWTCPGCVGTITSGGIYTPPTTLSTTGTEDIATCTLNSDTNVTVSVYIFLLPNSGNFAANTIRVDQGTSTASVLDGNGHYWLGNIGLQTGDTQNYSNTWQHYVGTGEQTIYNTSTWSYTDMAYKFIVPNGNYHVRVMSGWDYEMWGAPTLSTTAWNHSPFIIWSNDNGYTGRAGGSGGIKGLFWNMMQHAAFPYAQDSNSDYVFGTKVVNNELIVGVGQGNTGPGLGFPASGSQQSYPEVSGVEILPDASAPHWTIGITNGTSHTNPTSVLSDSPIVKLGKNIGLYVQDWYTGTTSSTTGAADPVWSILSGPGTLTAQSLMLVANHAFPLEVYTPPTSSPSNSEPIVIQACSQSQPSICAQTTLQIAGAAGSTIRFK